MQTFLPYPDLKQSLKVLDNKRLGKQRVEAYQIISAITKRPKLNGEPYKGWVNHPCTVMWKNHLNLLKQYYNLCVEEWVDRGFVNNMEKETINGHITHPEWFGVKIFHDSHKSNLLKKDFAHYSKFEWGTNINLPYIWVDEQSRWYELDSVTKKRNYLKIIKKQV